MKIVSPFVFMGILSQLDRKYAYVYLSKQTNMEKI